MLEIPMAGVFEIYLFTMNEIWKTIGGFENYEISSNGNIRNRKTLRILKKWLSHGYERIDIYHNGMPVHLSVHRIVAKEFIPNPENHVEVHHKNHIRNDNRVKNLEWRTSKLNQVEMWIHHLTKMGYKIIPPDN